MSVSRLAAFCVFAFLRKLPIASYRNRGAASMAPVPAENISPAKSCLLFAGEIRCHFILHTRIDGNGRAVMQMLFS